MAASGPDGRTLPVRFARALALAFVASLLLPMSVAAVSPTVTPATGGAAISADTAIQGGTGAYTKLTGPVIHETASGQLATGQTIRLALPTGFRWHRGEGSVDVDGVACLGLTATDPIFSPGNTVAIVWITHSSFLPCDLIFTGLEVRPLAGTPLAQGTIANMGTTGPDGSYGLLRAVPGAPILTVGTQPSASSAANAFFGSQPVFHDQDRFGNQRPGDTVWVGIRSGTGTAGAVLSCAGGLSRVTNAAGNAVFGGCAIDLPGTGYVLRGTTASRVAETRTITITGGGPDHLAFIAYPASSTPGLLSPQPVVAVVDAHGNVVDVRRSVTLVITPDTGAFTCDGGRSRTTVHGIATFTGCRQDVPGTYRLTVNDGPGGMAPILTPSFTVLARQAVALSLSWTAGLPEVTAPPSGATGGTPFPVQPTVRVEDASGSTVTSDHTTVVTLAIAAGTPAGGGSAALVCGGGLSRVVSHGIATFTGCRIDHAGTGYRIVASSSPWFTQAVSQPFTVSVGAAARLAFVAQPSGAVAGAPFTVDPVVAVLDAGGNVVTAVSPVPVTLALWASPGGGALSCASGTAAWTVAGLATFTGCRIDRAGAGYALMAYTSSGWNLSSTTGTPFAVTAAPAWLSIVPSSGIITWGGAVRLAVQISPASAGRLVDVQSSADGVTWTRIATLATNSAGTATLDYRPATNRWYRAVFAGAPDLQSATSVATRVVVRQILVLRPTTFGSVRTVAAGTTVPLVMVVRPARPELPAVQVTCDIYQWSGGRWIRIERYVVTGTGGTAVMPWTFSSPGRYYVRAMANPTPFNANSAWSAVERYDVR